MWKDAGISLLLVQNTDSTKISQTHGTLTLLQDTQREQTQALWLLELQKEQKVTYKIACNMEG